MDAQSKCRVASPPAIFVVRLEPEQVASMQGLGGRYWAGGQWDGDPNHVARAPVLDVGWPADAPLTLPFVAEWSGVLYVPTYGRYTLGVEAPGRIELMLDGVTLEGEGSANLEQLLAKGNHNLRLQAVGGQGKVGPWWQPPDEEPETVPGWALYSFPVSATGLAGRYYPNSDWQGAPALERIDPILDVYFHLTPLPRPYSVEWTGTLDVPANGVYALGMRAVDQAQLYLDGELVVEATSSDKYIEEFLELSSGLHDLRVSYQDLTGRSRIHIYWTRPSREREIIPSMYLRPNYVSP